ncbi:MAG: S8 family serine peptidase [Planctomycetota bacterium]
MGADRRERHDYTRPPLKIDPKPIPTPASRQQHGQALKTSFELAVANARARRAQAEVEVHGGQPGVYVEFESQPGVPLQLPSLEDKRKGIELVAVTESAGQAKEAVAFFIDLRPAEQADWANDLRERTTPPPPDAPAVSILDTGVNRGHPNLEAAIAEDDTHAVDREWGTHDNGGGPEMVGHGTEMAGLALYGDLSSVLPSDGAVRLRHRAESVKILPPADAAPAAQAHACGPC